MALTSSHSEVKSTQEDRHRLLPQPEHPQRARRGRSATSSGRRPDGARCAAPHAGRRRRQRYGLSATAASAICSKLSYMGGPAISDDRAALGRRQLAGRIVDLRRDVDEHRPPAQVRSLRGQADRRGAAERHADDAAGGGRHRLEERRHRLGILPRAVVAVVAAIRVPMAGQVDRHRRTVERQHDRVPGVGVLRAAVEEDELGLALAPAQVRELLPRGQREGGAGDDRLAVRTGCPIRPRSRAGARTRRSRPSPACPGVTSRTVPARTLGPRPAR